MNAVPIARDFGGLKRAALELLDEARLEPQRQRAERMAEYAENAEQILAGTATNRSLAEGYYVRISYLLELESLMHLGVSFASGELDTGEMRGLMALAAARRDFDALHPPCRKCGIRLENRGETTCYECVNAAARDARRMD